MNARMPHAALNIESRFQKARKIERLLGLDQKDGLVRLLEVGCGSGGISHYFATHQSGQYEVHAVDVKDSRVVADGFVFQQVSGTSLPYPDGHFDVVITNHVIEHVGDVEAQLHHLQEIRRVLKSGGVGYLAVPNRWMLVEPHYRLAFLSWLPVSMRSNYLSRFRGVPFYDCMPLDMKGLENLLRNANFKYENACIEAMHNIFRIEGVTGISQWLASKTPECVLKRLKPMFPTLIYRLYA